MADVFISYSRKDKEFVQVLHQALVESKYNAWIDWQDIPPTADWWAEIEAGIEAADAFIFVISPDSVASRVCNREIDHAVASQKRMVPIVRRGGFNSADIHRDLSKHNWLYFREDDDFELALASLVTALDLDLSYVKAHTRLLVRALEWEKKHRRDDLLLRGQDLTEAEQWLAKVLQANHDPLPTEQQKTYIRKSRDVEEAHQRLATAGEKAKRLVRIGAGVLAGTVAIATIIGIVTQRNVLRTRKLAQLEQDGVNALQQFEYQELEALLQAMQATEELKQLMGGGSKSLQSYAPHSPPWALQQILDSILQKNQFLKNPNSFSDEAVTAVFDPDGTTLAITSSDGEVTLKTSTGSNEVTLRGHVGNVWQAEFSPDGQRVASASDDQTFGLWNREGDLIKSIKHPLETAGRIRFSPDGRYIAISGWKKDRILLLDNDGNIINSINASQVNDIAFSPDSQTLVSASENGIAEIWDFQGNRINSLNGHNGSVTSVKFSQDGNYLATGSSDETIRILNLKTQETTVIPDLMGWVFALDFHPKGHQIAAGSSGGIAKIWDLEGNVVQSLPGHVGTVNSIDFSLDGNSLVTTSDDGRVRYWFLKGNEIADLIGHTDGIWNASVSPNNNHLATASIDRTAQVWDLSGKKIKALKLPEQNFNNVVYSPDGSIIATSTHQGNVQLWNLDGSFINSFKHHASRVLGLAFSPDGKHIVSGSDDNTAKLWDLEGNVLATVKHSDWIRNVAFSPNGQSFATASEDGLARLWDLKGSLMTEFKGHADGVDGISFSPDETQIVTSSDDSTVKTWDLQGHQIHSFQKHHGRVWTVEFSPDGESMATGSSDGYARIWDLNGNLLAQFKGHDAWISSVNFSPDGKYLLTTSIDGTAKVWQVAQTLDDLLQQGCVWLSDYLIMYPEELTKLVSCQSPELLQKSASQLIARGDLLAKEGNKKEAVSLFRTAKSWNPTLSFYPKVRVQQFADIGEAEALAQTGEIDAAIATFQKALELDPSLELDAKQEIERIAVDAFIQQGIDLAKKGEIAAAEVVFREALALNSNFRFDPKLKAQQLAANALIEQALEHLSAEEFKQAIAKVNQVDSLGLAVGISEKDWANLCMQAALNGFSAEILQACDRAVELDSLPGRWRSRRGIARALAGDREGAIADFQAYINWANTTNILPKEELVESIQTRQAWINNLRTGKNAFTPEKIEELKNGGF